MTQEELNAFLQDSRNWRAGVLYMCEDDPRIIVPNRIRWTGFTMNFAHGAAFPALLGILVALFAPFLLVLVLPLPQAFYALSAAFTVTVVVLAAVCHWEATRAR